MNILVLNAGSSTQKSAVFNLGVTSDEVTAPIWEGRIEWNESWASITTHNNRSKPKEERIPLEQGKKNERSEITQRMLEGIWSGSEAIVSSYEDIDVIGHRIVHGGPHLRESAVITSQIKRLIQEAAPFAPLHNQVELEGINLSENIFPGAPQIAVFDTSFHRTMPEFATLYPGPYDWLEKGIIRYGFHGINHHYCAKRAAQMLQQNLNSLKIVSCHLGNGCSLAAIDKGISVDTTMGFTPLDGLMMGTRSGAIDPGIVLYLAQHDEFAAKEIDRVLNHESGLLGISGHSSDMREVIYQAKAGHARSKLAFDMFIHVLCKGIVAMAASLSGIDAVIFTAGIGENSPDVRQAACDRLAFLGVKIDAEKNMALKFDGEFSAANSAVRILRIAAQEDWAIAEECFKLNVSKSQSSSALECDPDHKAP